jgi:hypothetical protein
MSVILYVTTCLCAYVSLTNKLNLCTDFYEIGNEQDLIEEQYSFCNFIS